MKRKIFIGLVCTIVLLVSSLVVNAGTKPMLTVNGDAIRKEEYEFLSQVASGGIKESKKESKIIAAKVEQQLLKEYNIMTDISYSHFKSSLKEENKRRANALEKGEKIYGPKQYEAKVYYDYLYSEAKERFIQEVLLGQITKEQVQSFIKLEQKEATNNEMEEQQIRYLLAQSMYLDILNRMVEDATVQ